MKTDITVIIHGHQWKLDDIREMIESSKEDTWWKQALKSRSALVHKSGDRTSPYAGQRDDPEKIEDAESGWIRDHCRICRWRLESGDDPEHNTGYTNEYGDWLCIECYDNLVASKGVLDRTYAEERQEELEFVFRYKVRAKVVENAVRCYLAKAEDLNILDFGVAEGLTLKELDQLLPGNNFIGIEYSAELIEQAPELPNNIKIVQGDVTRLDADIKGQSFDVVVALALLEHLLKPVEAVREAASVLRPGGIFVATSPHPFWDKVSTRLGLLKDHQHEIEMSNERFMSFAKDAGLEILTYERFMWAPLSVLPYLKIKISPLFSLKFDRWLAKLIIFNWLFVNQLIVARKPLEIS
jgi:2-polyprenyl-3-methyl-5-hydroxy-6-metoxy-1,4-benzoquinol methylase